MLTLNFQAWKNLQCKIQEIVNIHQNLLGKGENILGRFKKIGRGGERARIPDKHYEVYEGLLFPQTRKFQD